MRKAKLFSRKDNSFLRMAGWMMTLLFCTCLSVANLQAQNVIFVKSGVTNGDVITVDGVSGKAYTTPQAAISASAVGDTIRFTEDYTATSSITITNRVLDGNNHKLTASGTYSYPVVVRGGTVMNLTIRRTTVTGRIISIQGNPIPGDVVIDNCDIDDGTYGIHRDGVSNPKVALTIKNSTIRCWSSWSNAFDPVTITNCTFAKGSSGYAHLRPYGSAVVEDCSFSSDFSVSTTNGPIADNAIIFNNCDIAGTPLTSANLNSLLENHNQEASNQKGVVVNGNFSQDANGEITGGIFGGNPESVNSLCAPGYAAIPLGTTPQTYQVEPVYYVHFNAGGGTGTHGDSIVLRTAPTFTVPANTQFTYSTYPFLNWNSKMYGAGTDIAVNSTMNLTSDTTLYAEWDLNFVAKIGDNTYGTLQAALDDAHATMSGDKTIELVADITGYSIVHQKAGLNLTIEGHDHTLAGQIIIDGNARAAGTETLTIQNIAFNDDGSHFHSGTDGFIMVPSTKTTGTDYYTGAYNYAHNITISNCSLISTSSSLNVVGIKATSGATCYKLKVNNVTCDNLHSLAQLTATEGALIDNCTATNTGSFVNVSGGSGVDTISNCTFTGVDPSDGYAVRENSNSGVEIYLINNTFEANNVLQLGKNGGSDASGHINVESGTYKGNLANTQSASGTATFVFTGGTFNQPVATVQSYCAEHYMAIDEDPEPGYCTVYKMLEVTYDANGGSGTMTPNPDYIHPVAGNVTVANCAFTNDPWFFLNWNTKADGIGDTYIPGSPMTISSDTTLYAQWRGVAKIGDTHYATLNEAAAAVPVGTPTTITILQNLNFYDIASGNLADKTITFTGTRADTLTVTDLSHINPSAGYGSDLTFENITLKHDPTADNYQAIINVSKITCNDCEILGYTTGYAETVICNNCTFTQTTGKYHLWTYGSNCTFNSCTFNTSYNNGKAVNVYKEGALTQPYRVVTFNDCSFNAPTNPGSNRSAIQINSSNCCYVVNVNNCEVNGYHNEESTAVDGYKDLINNKNTSVATTLYIDGTQIIKQGSCDPVATIGDTYYNTLQDALNAAHGMTGDVTIEILRNFEEDATILQKAGLNYTIEGNNDTLNGRILVDGGRIFPNPVGEVTITNLNFTYNTSLTYGDATKGFICNSTNNLSYAAHVTVSNCTFDGGATGISGGMAAYRDPAGAQSWDITLDHLVAKNCHSLVQATSVSGMVITNCTAIDNVKNGINISGGGSDHIPGVTNVYTITNDTLACNADGEYSIRIQQHERATDTFNLADNLFTAPKAIISKGNTACVIAAASGLYDGKLSVESSDAATFSFTGGTFTNLGGADDAADSTSVKEKCATGYGCYKNVDTYPAGWTVLKMYWVTYDANGGDGSMEPSYVAPFPNSSFTTKNNEFTWTTTFTNWNTKADGTGDTYAEGDPMVISSDTTLYAQWNIVATVGGKAFSSLQAAVDYANDNLTGDVTIDLQKNTMEWVLIVQKAGLNLTIDGHNDTLTGQIIIDGEARHCGTETLDITNLNFIYDAAAFAIYTNSTTLTNGFVVTPTNKGPADAPYKTTRNYIYSHNITVSNCTFDGAGSTELYAFKGAWGSNPRNIKLDNCTAKNVFGFAFFAGVSHCDAVGTTGIEITDCEATDNIQQALYISGGGSSTHNITDNTFTAQDFAVYIDNAVNSPTYNFSGNTMEADTVFKLKLNDNGAGGAVASTTEINITDGTYIGMIKDYDPTTHLNISGGTYSEDVTGEPCAPGYAAFANGTTPETWTVTKAWFLFYDKNEAGASGTMDTLFVKQSGTVAERTLVVDNCNFTWLPDHSFLAWNTKANALGDTLRPGDNIILSSDTTLYVIWQLGYTVIYDNNGGTGSIPNQYKAVGETIILSDGTDGAGTYLFTKPDSTLYRWNTAADEGGDNYALGAEYSANANATMYAVWRLNLDMTMDSTDVVCYGENNGTDTVKIIGGEAPFQIVLSSTVMADNDTVKNLMDRTYIFTNLKPGSYNVQLTDVLTKDTIRGHFTIAQPDTLIVESMTVPVKPCPLMGTGVYNVSMTTTGGNGGNHFTWGEAAVNVDAMASTVIPGADDRDSTYTVAVKVTDKKGCVATDTTTFAVSPVIADDGTVHANSKLTIDTIRQGIMRGCDTVLRQFGTPHFTSTNPAITEDILDTIYNNIPTAYPDSVFYLGENKVIWTATDTCGHSITGEQVIIIYHYPCPNVSDVDGNDYPSVRLGCDCWMAENLKTTKFSDGRAISNLMKYESPTHPDADANFAIYGYLYDWTTALDAAGGVTPDADGNVQGVCPTGWHMPTDLDFANVAGVHGRNDISDLRYDGYWLDGGGNNSTGFSLLPGGCYNDNTARYENILGEAYLWSVNSANPSQPKVFWADCHCYMWQMGDPSANMGCSVRCVKD